MANCRRCLGRAEKAPFSGITTTGTQFMISHGAEGFPRDPCSLLPLLPPRCFCGWDRDWSRPGRIVVNSGRYFCFGWVLDNDNHSFKQKRGKDLRCECANRDFKGISGCSSVVRDSRCSVTNQSYHGTSQTLLSVRAFERYRDRITRLARRFSDESKE